VIEVLTTEKFCSPGKQLLPASIPPREVAPCGPKKGQRSQGAASEEEMINRVWDFLAKAANTIVNSAIG